MVCPKVAPCTALLSRTSTINSAQRSCLIPGSYTARSRFPRAALSQITRVLLMKGERMFLIVLAGVMLALFVAVWLWQNPGLIRGRLRAREIAQFMARIERLPFPADE